MWMEPCRPSPPPWCVCVCVCVCVRARARACVCAHLQRSQLLLLFLNPFFLVFLHLLQPHEVLAFHFIELGRDIPHLMCLHLSASGGAGVSTRAGPHARTHTQAQTVSSSRGMTTYSKALTRRLVSFCAASSATYDVCSDAKTTRESRAFLNDVRASSSFCPPRARPTSALESLASTSTR